MQVTRMLADAGFDENAMRAAIGSAPFPAAVPLHARRVSEPGVMLVRLFVLGEEVPAEGLPVDFNVLVAHGLAERDGDIIRPLVRLTPHEGFFFAHDDERNPDSDFVTGINNATRTLTALTVRKRVERALDLGTGCGVQALLATRHADTVVATDVNPRALHYAELNSTINETPVDARGGSWFEPVGREQFDLIVANPPFVISPDNDFVFRDSALDGDAICREVVRGAAKHLRTGGFATVLCNWICRSPDETWEPLEPWVAGTGCDALLLAHRPVDPFQYAAQWNEPISRDPDTFASTVDRWLAYYEREGITAIGIGAVVLRRRDSDVWVRGLDVPTPAVGNAGPHILRLFAATDQPLPDDFSAERFLPINRHRLDQRLRFGDEYAPATVTMSLEEGVGTVANVDARALPVLFALDGETTVAELLPGLENEDIPVALTVLRQLYDLGLVERKTPSPSATRP